MKVRHPQYGVGTVKTISEHSAEIRFDDSQRTVEPQSAGLEPAEPQVAVSGLSQPLAIFVAETAAAVVRALGLEKPDSVLEQLLPRWHNGRMVLHSGTRRCKPRRCRWKSSSQNRDDAKQPAGVGAKDQRA